MLVPLINRVLGAETSGLWLGLQGIVLVMSLADFGFCYLLSRQAAFVNGGGRVAGVATDVDPSVRSWEDIRFYLLRIKAYNRWGSSIGMLVLAGLLFVFALNARSDTIPLSLLLETGAILSLGALLNLLAKPDIAMLEGAGRYVFVRVLLGTQYLLATIVMLLMLWVWPDIRGLALGSLTASVFAMRVARRHCTRFLKTIKAPASPSPTEAGQSIFRKALPLGLVQLSAYIVSSLQVPVVAMFFDTKQVAPFFFVHRMAQFSAIAITQMVLAQLPGFSSELGGGRYDHADARVRRACKSLALVGLLPSLAVMCLAPLVLPSLFPGQELSQFLFIIMAIELYLSLLSSGYGQFVLASGRNPFFLSSIFTAFSSIGFLYLLHDLGLLSLPLSVLLAGAIAGYWVNFRQGYLLLKRLRSAAESRD